AAPAEGEFDRCFDCLIEPALAQLDEQLAGLAELTGTERQAVLSATVRWLTDTIRRKVSRLLLVELNAARLDGSLAGTTSEQRWLAFLDRAASTEYWLATKHRYPTMLDRLARIIERRCAAACELAQRWCADRAALADFLGLDQAVLSQVDFGQGDSHRGGRSVAQLVVGSSRLIYKPRSLAIDHQLNELLALAFDAERTDLPAHPVRAAQVLRRDGYGWSEFIEHRYCSSTEQLRCYYTGIGHWLAIARLLGTTDLHAENLIACGPVPVLIDCETLFTPMLELAGLGMGQATDLAFRMISSTVVESGLLPGRGTALGWRGVDISATGSLPGQQPMMPAQRIVDAGTDHARLSADQVPAGLAANLPSAEPELGRYWPDVLSGFDWMVDRLTELDHAGELAPAIRCFADVEVRAVLRATESYAELARMLWHPISLHDEPAAVARAADLLAKQARIRPSAPSDPAVIAAEVADLLTGDVPFFITTARDGKLAGPQATRWGTEHDLIEQALASWRSADLATERELIRASLVSAYYNEGWQPERDRMTIERTSTDALNDRRAALAESVLRTLRAAAVRGQDGTATWIAPVFNVTGW
ncbi:MAG: type 2 lanthipeptide synthetase LanM, partial [Jatrophihabitantaceae bacterium]